MEGRTGWQQRPEGIAEIGARGTTGSAIPIRLAAALSRSMEISSSEMPGSEEDSCLKSNGEEIWRLTIPLSLRRRWRTRV